LSYSNFSHFTNNINTTFKILNMCFTANFLSLNFSKTYFTYFTTKLNKFIEPKFDYGNNVIPTTSHTKFLGVTIDCMFYWSKHIELLTSKLNSVCYLIRNVKSYMSVSF
jgi:hypothetical protein